MDSELNSEYKEGYRKIYSEIKDARQEIKKLSEKINLIEYDLSRQADRLVNKKTEPPKEKVVQKPEIRVEKQTPKPIFKDSVAQKVIKEPRKSVDENFEQALGGKWFNKLGIFAVVIGVALLIGYSFKYLGPVGKIGIGYAFGLGMLLFGHYIEKKEGFSVYGKGLIGGGWAIVYFTTFAMHHISAVRLISNPVIDMVLLLGVSAYTIWDIQRYKSQVATGFSYLLVFITLMITPVSIYTMAAAVPVAISLAFFMSRMNWAGFGIYGMSMTYLTFMVWLGKAYSPATHTITREYLFFGLSFLALYWSIFVAAVLVTKDEKDSTVSPGPIKVGPKEFGHILNSTLMFFNIWLLLSSGFTQYFNNTLAVLALLYVSITALTYIMKKKPLYIISSTFAIIFAAMLLSNKYTGYSLTVSYIILAQIILGAGILFKESYWRIFSFGILVVALAKLLVVDSFIVKNTALAYHLSGRTLLFVFAFIIYLANHVIYSRLAKNGRLVKAEENHARAISYLYPTIYVMGTWLDLPKVLTAPCWAILAIVLLQLGVSKNNYDQRMQGYVLSIAAFLRLLMSNMLIQGGISILSYRVLTSVPVALLLYYCVMLLQDEKIKAILKDSEKKMESIFPYMVFIIIMFLAWYEAPKNLIAPIWGVVAVVYSLRGVSLRKNYYLSISSLAALSAGTRALFVNLLQSKYLIGAESPIIYPLFTIAVLYGGNIIYLKSKQSLKDIEGGGEGRIKTFFHSSKLVYGLAATILLTALLMIKLNGVLLTVALGAAGMLLFLAGFGFKEKPWRIYGLVMLLMTLVKIFLIDLRNLSTLYYIASLIVLGIALLFVSYMYTKHKDKFKKLI